MLHKNQMLETLGAGMKSNNSQKNLFGLMMIETALEASSIIQFEKTFLYGKDLMIMHKGRPKQMSVYLDSKREMLLWISSKTKAFILDLYLSAVYIKRQTSTEGDQSKKYYLLLHQLQEEVTFVFTNENQRNQYFHLFSRYINNLKKRNPNYSIYFSNINKIQAHYSTKNGTTLICEQEILEISKTVGHSNKKQNIEILQSCMKFHKVSNKKDISLQCFDDYFAIHFCNPQVQPIFQRFSEEKVGDVKVNPRAILNKIMSPKEFQNFLRKCQKQTEVQINKALKKYSGDLSFEDFSRYLYDSQLNNASRIQQTPLDYPLKDYFCYSSHNTYLSGNQLTSDSQVQRYSQDLGNGIKCVQLDIHDDSSKPMVNHAFKSFSLCKPIDFEDVIKQIKNYSVQCELEKQPHYPVILSLENHASFENREFMLEIICRNFGNRLFCLENQVHFPTLGQMMGKIIIKTNSEEEQIRMFKKKAVGKKLTNKTSSIQINIDNEHVAEKNRFSNKQLADKFARFLQRKEVMKKEKKNFDNWYEGRELLLFAIIKEMTKITSIFKSRQGIKGKELSEFGCCSLTNTATIQALAKTPDQLLNYTRTSWLRTYPHGTEISSYNYDPAQMLAVGAQIIALNTQTKDDYAWMMHGYFCGGHSLNLSTRGYVLKPSRLRLQDQFIPDRKPQKEKLTIKIIESGGQSVKTRFLGLPSDMKINSEGKNQFIFENPDQSFIIFDIGSKYRNCVAVRWILEGYRVIEGKAIDSYIDCGKRVLIYIKRELSS